MAFGVPATPNEVWLVRGVTKGEAKKVLPRLRNRPGYDGWKKKVKQARDGTWGVVAYYPIKKNPTSFPKGKFIKVEAVRYNRNGTVTVKVKDSVVKRNPTLRRNTAGFIEGGVFHPIRSGAGYDPSMVGESRKRKPAKRKAAKKKAAPKRKAVKRAAPKKKKTAKRRR